jgi:RNA recognition motif-containing protein
MKSRNQGGRAIRQNGPYKNNNGKRNGNNHGNNNRRVYVNNLTWETSWQELKDHFKQVGQVVRADILEEPNGRSKGCGIVEFQSPSDAIQAVESLNNSELNGRVIYVREDRESPSKVNKLLDLIILDVVYMLVIYLGM